MGSRTCYVCAGRGTTYTTESRPNHGPGGPTMIPVQVSVRCVACGGSGQVYEPDPPPSILPGPRKNDPVVTNAFPPTVERGQSKAGKSLTVVDRLFGVVGFVAAIGIAQEHGLTENTYVLLAIGLVAGSLMARYWQVILGLVILAVILWR